MGAVGFLNLSPSTSTQLSTFHTTSGAPQSPKDPSPPREPLKGTIGASSWPYATCGRTGFNREKESSSPSRTFFGNCAVSRIQILCTPLHRPHLPPCGRYCRLRPSICRPGTHRYPTKLLTLCSYMLWGASCFPHGYSLKGCVNWASRDRE